MPPRNKKHQSPSPFKQECHGSSVGHDSSSGRIAISGNSNSVTLSASLAVVCAGPGARHIHLVVDVEEGNAGLGIDCGVWVDRHIGYKLRDKLVYV